MPPRSKTKRVTTSRPKTRARALKKNTGALTADALGVASDQLMQAQGARSFPVVEGGAVPPYNLPVGARTSINIRDSLVAPRTSFWLGVGFGMLIVGALVTIAWQLFRVETVEAIVVGLTRS